MIGFQLTQGMGNNFFQIALTTTLARRLGSSAQFHPSPWMTPARYRSIFKGDIDFGFNPAQAEHVHVEPHFHYAPVPARDNMELRGYFQSPKYFDKEVAFELFEPRDEVMDAVQAMYDPLLCLNPVAVHVRRGDYVKRSEYHPVHGMDYFDKAMALFPEAHFIIFSDDMPWCHEHFGGKSITFIERDVQRSQFEPVDFFLMASCAHNIITNSTFSYWAAFLNRTPGRRVIAPAPWFGPAYVNRGWDVKDLCPEDWEIIEAKPWEIE